MSYFNQPKLEQHLRLKNLNPKTIDLYINGVRRACIHFGHDLREMTRDEFVTYFADLAKSRSQSTLHVDECGLKFYFREVLQLPWPGEGVFKRKASQTILNIVTQAEMQQIINNTRMASYRVLFFVLYSMGLRLRKGLVSNAVTSTPNVGAC